MLDPGRHNLPSNLFGKMITVPADTYRSDYLTDPIYEYESPFWGTLGERLTFWSV